MSWWCVQVAPGFEARIRKQLQVSLRRCGARVVLPMRPFKTKRHGLQWRKLRPGFLFVEAEMSDELLAELSATRGVGAVDGVDGVPRPLPADVAEQLERAHIGAPVNQRGRRGVPICVGRVAGRSNTPS